jgi:hypothetical protein
VCGGGGGNTAENTKINKMAMISHFLGLISVIVNELKSSIKKQRG